VTGLHYVFVTVGNVYLEYTDSPTPIYAQSLQNRSPLYVSSITPKVDAGSTKFRLVYDEPYSDLGSGSGSTTLLTPSASLADLLGLSSTYSTYSADISYVETRLSTRAVKSGTIASGYGSTASRPVTQLYVGYPYFDTTLGKPVWYNGSGWVDATGASV